MKVRIGLIFILGIFLWSNPVHSSPNFSLRPSLICSSSIGQKMLLKRLVHAWVAEKGFSITIDVLWDSKYFFLIEGTDVVALVNYSRGIDENGNIEITVANQYVQDPYRGQGLMTMLQSFLFYICEADKVVYWNCKINGRNFVYSLERRGFLTDVETRRRGSIRNMLGSINKTEVLKEIVSLKLRCDNSVVRNRLEGFREILNDV